MSADSRLRDERCAVKPNDLNWRDRLLRTHSLHTMAQVARLLVEVGLEVKELQRMEIVDTQHLCAGNIGVNSFAIST